MGDYLDKVGRARTPAEDQGDGEPPRQRSAGQPLQLLAYLELFGGGERAVRGALSGAQGAIRRPEMQGTLALVEQALAKPADEQGSAIVLGARITGPAAEAAKAGVGAEQDLRDSYRDAVQGLPRPLCRLARHSQPPAMVRWRR